MIDIDLIVRSYQVGFTIASLFNTSIYCIHFFRVLRILALSKCGISRYHVHDEMDTKRERKKDFEGNSILTIAQ